MSEQARKHVKEICVAYQTGGVGCPDCYCDSTCQDDSCHVCGGNTPGRIDDQIEWLEEMIVKELKKENIKLRSLCRRASEEIRELDTHIITLVEAFEGAGEVIGYNDDPLAMEGMSSINLLNRLNRITSGGYVENYPDLHEEMKQLDGQLK